MSASLKPDPSMIGGVAKVPLARLPDPEAVFATRAERFAFLAGYNPNLAPYLEFLAAISRVQAGLVRDLPAPAPLPAERIELARSSRMPPLDRNQMRAGLSATLDALLDRLAGLDMPEPARARLTGEMHAALTELGCTCADTMIGNRVAFAEAMGEGLSAAEWRPSAPAAKEVAALASEVNAL